MKLSALKTLVCPITKQTLVHESFLSEGEEIIDGVLRAISGSEEHEYPIIAGVPRMLPKELRQHLKDDYPSFYSKYAEKISLSTHESDQKTSTQRHTQEAFGYEWTWAKDYNADNFEDWLPDGHSPQELFEGKAGLEVGCGAGRHAENTSRLAKSHFAVDLSEAVDSAFERNRSTANCHVVQADAFHLPFREGSFEYVYCLGVLQHMHNPPEGFEMLAKYPKAGGTLLVNVYQAGRPFTVGLLSVFRKISTRLSNEQLRVMSTTFGYLEYYLFFFPWKIIKKTPLKSVVAPIVPTRVDEYSKHSLRTCVVDWFDRLSCPVKIHYRKEDLESWYRKYGYTDISVTPYWKAFWNGYGIKK